MPQRKAYLCLKVTFRNVLLSSHIGQKSVVGRESAEKNVVVKEYVIDEEVLMPEKGEEEEDFDTDRDTVMTEEEDAEMEEEDAETEEEET
eukprot:1862828-Ditylum_brightwellii.AAC.1